MAIHEPSSPDGGFRRVICGVDGSPESCEALRQGLEIAEPDAICWAVSVWDPAAAVHPEIVDQLRANATTAARDAAEMFPSVRPSVVAGREVAGLLTEITNRRADLVCVGSHGTSRRAGIVYGSVASAMVHHAPCSVLVARSAHDAKFPKLIVHANDGSAESLAAARAAGRIAARAGSTVVTLHVGETHDTSVAEEAVAIIESCGREPVMKVEHGSPHHRIVEVATSTGAALIAMGSRGLTGVKALGSVSERVAHEADCSVLIVRPATPSVHEEPDSR